MPSKLLSTAVLPCLADVAVPRIIATTSIIGCIGLAAGLTLRRAGFTTTDDRTATDGCMLTNSYPVTGILAHRPMVSFRASAHARCRWAASARSRWDRLLGISILGATSSPRNAHGDGRFTCTLASGTIEMLRQRPYGLAQHDTVLVTGYSGRETAHPADPSAALRTGRGSARRHSRPAHRNRLANRTELIGASAR